MPSTRHLVIAGTGRAGTTFLVEYLRACGLDTGPSDMAYHDRPRAGLERSLLDDRSAYVVKDPWFYEIAPLLDLDDVTIDAVIVPVRDLRAVAASRLRNELADLAEQGLPPGRYAMGRVPGGALYPLDIESQMRTVAVGQALLLQWCVEHSIDVCLLAYPRLATDSEYLYEQLRPHLPASLTRERAAAAFEQVSRPAEPVDDAIAAASHERLQAELAALHTLVAEQRASAADARAALAMATAALAQAQVKVRDLEARLSGQSAEAAQATAAELRRLEEAVEVLTASEAYRVGRAVTWPARHAKRLLLRRP